MIKVPAVAKVDNKWWVGFLDGYKFIKIEEIDKLSDIKERTDYKTLALFLKTYNAVDGELEKIIEKTGCDSIYVLQKPIGLNEKQFRDFWWMDKYTMCKTCVNDCKQSHMISDLKCKNYERGI